MYVLSIIDLHTYKLYSIYSLRLRSNTILFNIIYGLIIKKQSFLDHFKISFSQVLHE